MKETQQVSGQNLTGKVTLLTGACGILGRRFAESFAASGSSMVLVDLDQAALSLLADELAQRHGVEAIGLACDIASTSAVDAMVTQAVAHFGHIDILLNNAATKGHDVRAFFEPFETYSLDVWREVMSVNIDGMFLISQRVGREMITRGTGGAVVQISSIYGLMGPDSRIYEGSYYLGGEINTPAVYSASKAAVIGLSRHLATTWAEHGIRVNCVAPGGVGSGQNSEFGSRYSARVPLRRMAKADEIAAAVLFLASDAASYITGQLLAVDGGLSAW